MFKRRSLSAVAAPTPGRSVTGLLRSDTSLGRDALEELAVRSASLRGCGAGGPAVLAVTGAALTSARSGGVWGGSTGAERVTCLAMGRLSCSNSVESICARSDASDAL